MKKVISQISLLSIALAFAIGLQYVNAWTGPTAQPPNSNIAAPVNVSATAQVKDGGLGVLGNFYTAQRLGIGTGASSPTHQLVLGDESNNSIEGIKFPDGTVQTTAATGGGMGQMLHVRDEKAAGTAGGTFTAGAWVTRTLNTVKTNAITGASLSSNRITLPAGTYYIDARAPASQVLGHVAKLANITDGTDTIIGSAELNGTGSAHNVPSWVRGRFTIASQKTFEIQHRSTNSLSTTGFGRASDVGVTEVYTEVLIWKVN